MRKILTAAWLFLSFITTLQAQDERLVLPEDIAGSIAYIGADYNVYTANLSTGTTAQLTTDGSRSRRYQWVTWSPDNRLAYFCCDLQFARSFDTTAYVSPDGIAPGRSVFESQAEPIIYAAWAPAACGAEANCRDLALLVNDVLNGTLRVDLIRDYKERSGTVRTIAQGSPFYFNWNPAGSQMVFHRNNRSIDVYDFNSNATLPAYRQRSSGSFQAPAWSPVDDRILVGTAAVDERRTNLTILANETQKTLLADLNGRAAFLWSPDGNYVAYRTLQEGKFGAVFVIDAVTGDIISRSSSSDVVAFFWSPDSSKLAYITFSTPEGSFDAQTAPSRQFIQQAPVQNPVQNVEGLAWSVLNVETGLNRQFSTFLPTSEMVYLLLYFDQFAVSHHVWSPDSHYLVYTEVTALENTAQPVVNILDVRLSNSVPLTISQGVFAVWSMR